LPSTRTETVVAERAAAKLAKEELMQAEIVAPVAQMNGEHRRKEETAAAAQVPRRPPTTLTPHYPHQIYG
jgi:hypothetical protein